MQLLKRLWSEDTVNFDGEFDTISNVGLKPLPIQQPIPMWIGARSCPARSVIKRIGRLSDGWFVLCEPEQYPALQDRITAEAETASRAADAIGREAGIAVVGPREAEWQDRVISWYKMDLTHLCLRTLGGQLSASEHLTKLEQTVKEIPDNTR